MTTSNFAAHMAEDRRLVLLRVLLESAAYTTNEYLLQSMLERFGHAVSSDRVHTDLAWLAEQDLVEMEVVGDVVIAKLLARGEDVAKGRVVVPGVKRPRAG